MIKLKKRVVYLKPKFGQKTFACQLLVSLHVLLGIGAVFGGLGLIIDPSGELIKMPISLLAYSPFSSFLIPGVILLVVLGIAPMVAVYGLIKRKSWKLAEALNLFPERHWSWTLSLSIGFMLIAWIIIQVYFSKEAVIVHVVYVFLGLLIQAVTLLPSVQYYYSREYGDSLSESR